MKKLLMVLGFMIASAIVWGQATPTANLRVASATTPFGVNVPVGYIVYDYGADKGYFCKAATASTATLTTGAANFSEIAAGEYVAIADTATMLAPYLLESAAATTYLAKADTATMLANYLQNGEAVSTYVAIADTSDMLSNYARAHNSLLTGTTHLGGTLTVVGTAEDASPDSIITVAAGVFKKSSMAAVKTALAIPIAIVEDLEVATADSISGRYYFVPSQVPIATTVSVQVNGLNLMPTTQYTIVSNKIRIGFNLGLYDKLTVTYSY